MNHHRNSSMVTLSVLSLLCLGNLPSSIDAFTTPAARTTTTTTTHTIPFHSTTTRRYVSTLSRPEETTTTTGTIDVVDEQMGSMLEVAFDTSMETISQDEKQEEEEIIEKKEPNYQQEGFVYGLAGSGLERTKGKKEAQVVVEGDSLVTTPGQRAFVSATFLGHFYFAASSILQLFEATGHNVAVTGIESLVVCVVSYLFSDLGSGVLHWSVDNYGNGKTPVMGGIIAAFQGHHMAPWTIAERGFCNNVYKLCIPFGIVPMLLINAISGPVVTLFFAIFACSEILSQEFHKWTHMKVKECPPYVKKLQKLGLTIPRNAHAFHHIAPYDGNYCIVSGVWNKLLDNSGFFRSLEHIVYKINGIEANAWKLDPELRTKTLNGDYSL